MAQVATRIVAQIAARIINCGSTPGRGGIEGKYLHKPSGKSEIVPRQAKHIKRVKFTSCSGNQNPCKAFLCWMRGGYQLPYPETGLLLRSGGAGFRKTNLFSLSDVPIADTQPDRAKDMRIKCPRSRCMQPATIFPPIPRPR
ncbi:DNA protection during starvation domain protein [Brucella rhizosphaerae]|uniref:DNA protection during starvation domain protein n=1 Tax=Brucella rhizosphaerae TaxID=571254 RepID=A0A256F3Z5_9HYPH|nr:DNA protection during starvation domain protein [Brucella rhizosphaerae]